MSSRINNDIRYTFDKSRSGETVPAIALADGDVRPLHSMIDPSKEAQRLVSSIGDMGFLVFLGLGGAFAPKAALKETSAHVLVIDYDRESIKQLLANKDYSPLLNNSRFCLLVDPSDEKIRDYILENYKPALYGGIRTIPLRPRIEHDMETFDNAASVIQKTIEAVSNDYSVQAHFGMRWFSNIIRNIKNAKNINENFISDKEKNPVNEAAIIAAGPSLDIQMDKIAELKSKNVFLISTDTALGALLHNGIIPDAAVSIDCQHISYYHFMNAGRSDTCFNIPLVLDIASPPLLSGFSSSPVYFSSGHPLAVYSNANWQKLPCLDTSGGNVTYACLSLAQRLGARKITLFAADFSYVNSQSYARGTYIYPYFYKKQNRLAPIESLFSAFLYRSPFLQPENNEKQNYRETSSLRFYRKKLEEKAALMDAQIICAPGNGAEIRISKNENTYTENKILYEYGRKQSGMEFLIQYKNDIKALPAVRNGETYMNGLNSKEKQIATTLLPCAAAIRKRKADLKQIDLLEETKKLCIREIEKILD